MSIIVVNIFRRTNSRALAATIALLAAASHAHADVGDVRIRLPIANPGAGNAFTADITVDAGGQVLGSYQFRIQYDPNVVTIAGINGGTTQEFSDPPTTNPQTFATGATPFSGINSGNFQAPTGVVNVARITFNAVGQEGDMTELRIQVGQLLAANTAPIPGNPIPTQLTLGEEQCMVPNVRRIFLQDALSSIAAAGLPAQTIAFFPSDTVPMNFVINQDPPPGATVDCDTTVNLIVSTGENGVACSASERDVRNASSPLTSDLLFLGAVSLFLSAVGRFRTP